MTQRSRKHTAWRKNRRFSDVHGGRESPKYADNIVRRTHSLKRPGPDDELPIIISENPSRDFFFPVSPEQVLERLAQQPADHVEGLTHIWFRRKPRQGWHAKLLGAHVGGSGVEAIILYPWPVELTQQLGKERPTGAQLSFYRPFCERLVETKRGWELQWEKEELRRFYLEGLLLHELGHHCDYRSRLRNPAQKRQAEDFADTYATSWRLPLHDESYDIESPS